MPVIVDRRNGDHVTLVRPTCENAAIQRLDSLRFGNARVKSARDIHRHVMAADRESTAVHEPPTGEHRDGGRARTHVDQGSAEVSLVVGKHGQSRRIGARHQGADLQVATLDRQDEVARHGDIGRHGMHIDAEAAPQHAARITDAGHFVERIADRQGMQHRPPGANRMLAAGREHTRDVAVGNGLACHIDGRGHQLARRLAGRKRDHD